jgi:homopolymeric O-antigen transport system permease protein
MEATAATPQPRTEPITVIEPTSRWMFPDLREIWRYRDLLYFMVRRDVVINYKQAIGGVGWVVIKPLLMAGLFAVFLGLLQRLPSEQGIPYSLFAVSGLVLWVPFGDAINKGTLSTVLNEQLITKIYFPRLLIPLASACAPALDMVIGVGVVVVIALAVGIVPPIQFLAMPVILLLTVMIGAGLAIWFSGINVRYRDAAQFVAMGVLAGLFITPITYPFELVNSYLPDWLVPVYSLNPMVGILEAFRWSALGTDINLWLLIPPLIAAPLLLATGALYFSRAERDFADVI